MYVQQEALEYLVGDIKHWTQENHIGERTAVIEFLKWNKHEIGVSIPLDTNKISKDKIFGDDRHSMYGPLGNPPCLRACKHHPGVMS